MMNAWWHAWWERTVRSWWFGKRRRIVLVLLKAEREEQYPMRGLDIAIEAKVGRGVVYVELMQLEDLALVSSVRSLDGRYRYRLTPAGRTYAQEVLNDS